MKAYSIRLAAFLGMGILLGIPTIALAQDAPTEEIPVKPSPGLAPDTSIEPEAPVTPAVSDTIEPGQISYNTFIFALGNLSDQVETIATLDDLSIEDVKVVDARTLINENNPEVLNQAIAQNDAEIQTLQESLMSNKVLYKALASRDVEIEDVVAVNISDDGDVLIFHQ